MDIGTGSHVRRSSRSARLLGPWNSGGGDGAKDWSSVGVGRKRMREVHRFSPALVGVVPAL